MKRYFFSLLLTVLTVHAYPYNIGIYIYHLTCTLRASARRLPDVIQFAALNVSSVDVFFLLFFSSSSWSIHCFTHNIRCTRIHTYIRLTVSTEHDNSFQRPNQISLRIKGYISNKVADLQSNNTDADLLFRPLSTSVRILTYSRLTSLVCARDVRIIVVNQSLR